MTNDPSRAMSQGSPALAMLLVALGGAIVSRALVGRSLLARTPKLPAPPDHDLGA
jgi:hypothetical protein